MFGRKSLSARNQELRDENRTLRQQVLKRDRRLEQIADDPMGKMVNNLPEGVIIKRITPRTSEFKWMCQYRKNGTEYYGLTLEEALTELFRKNETVRERYLENLKTGKYTKG